MSKQSKMVEALQEVLEDVKGKKLLKERAVNIEDVDVYKIRQKYQLTQLEFSQMFGFSLRTLQQWEQKRRRPHGAALILLKVVDYAPDIVSKALHH
ncbi:MAG: type II toxin-antitoxin system MqsA family antitoxin [Alphaproteobacteria bacterium]|nr:type II toxin-antitoxin system MqsA family antitoxin [Alphaproteobacteria bacterium]